MNKSLLAAALAVSLSGPMASHAALLDLSGFQGSNTSSFSATSAEVRASGRSITVLGDVTNLLSFDYIFSTAPQTSNASFYLVTDQALLLELSTTSTANGISTGLKTYNFANPYSGSLGFVATANGAASPTVNLTLENFVAQDVVSAVPEPETYALLLAGLGLTGWVARRRQRVVSS